MNKKILKTVIVNALTVAFLIVSCNAEVLKMTPFGFSTHLAVLLAGGSPLASLYFVAAASLVGLSLPAFAVSAAVGATGALVGFFVRFMPQIKRKKLWRYILHLGTQPAVYGVMLWLYGETRLIVLLSVGIGVIGGCLVAFAAPLLASGNFVRPTAFGYAGLGAFCLIFFAGLEPVGIGVFSVARFCFAIFLLLACKCRGGAGALICGLLAGLGASLPTANAEMFAVCALSALCAALFAEGARPLSAVAMLLGWTIGVWFFGVMTDVGGWQLLALGSGALVVLLLPKRALGGIRGYFRPAERLLAVTAAAGMGRKLPERLLRTGEALGEMSTLLAEDAGMKNGMADGLTESLRTVCAACEKRGGCEVERDLHALAEDAVAGGSMLRARILALPCASGGRLLKQANDKVAELSEVLGRSERELQSARSYARRLDSLRKLLAGLAKSVTEDYRYDGALSARLMRELPEFGIPCGGALTTAERCGVAVLPSETETGEAEKAIGKVLGGVRVDRADELAPGWKAVAFSPAPAYDILYAVAQKPKQGNTACGDSYTVSLFGNTAVLSLCDGSGSGRGAARLSQTTLSLLESHYRAGFDAADGIASVNAFLSSRAGEEFSALDVISVDLQTCEADIVKAGSPSTFLLRGDSMVKIDGSSLPVGAVETVSYALAKKRLRAGDVLVFTTDGVSDALPNLPEVIAAQSVLNVQRMADGVLAAAMGRGVRDDMSVLVARIVAK